MRCPHCKNRLLQKAGDETRLRIQGIVRFDDKGVARAQCHWCKQSVELPIRLDDGLDLAPERYVVPSGSLTPSGRTDTS